MRARALAGKARALLVGASWRRRPRWFREQALDLASWNLFDLGIVDLHQRGALDVFTVNHNSRQSLLENDGQGRFREAFTELGLDQDATFPDWANDLDAPLATRPGLYLYRSKKALVVRTVADRGGPSVPARLELASPATVLGSADACDAVEEEQGRRMSLRFAGRSDGVTKVTPELLGLPVSVSIDPGSPLERVFVGPTMASPPGHDFVLRLRDRHGTAWADFNDDGRLDVFIARGGLKGRLPQYEGAVQDELYVNDGSGFKDMAATHGLRKGTCRSRQAAWVELGPAEGLCLFVSCQSSSPQMFSRRADGRFVDVAEPLGLNQVRGDCFLWIDVDGDGRAELVAALGRTLVVYRREGEGPFTAHQTVPLRGGPVRKLAVGDLDGDGDADLFAAARGASTLLLNEEGAYHAVDPASVGLPSQGAVTASWVDYDNDGLVDLHVIPGGLFRQGSGGLFAPTRLLNPRPGWPLADGRVTWFDSNGDGNRDAVVATAPRRGEDVDWRCRLFRNLGSTNHWLQVDLRGPPRNPHGLGAVVRVSVAGRRGTQWVGGNEGSHFSQGHYRLYFGLGEHPYAESVAVTWPDGSTQELGRLVGDERHTVEHPGALEQGRHLR